MARRLRTQLPDGVFHVTTRGVDRCAIFRDDADRFNFLQLLAECVSRFDWTVHAFCLMTNHYHLLLQTTVERLWPGMKRLNGVHALRFNKRHKRTGHLFGDRYASWVVEGDDYLAAACEYVLANPVRAGLCRRADDWPWSGSKSGLARAQANTCSPPPTPIHWVGYACGRAGDSRCP